MSKENLRILREINLIMSLEFHAKREIANIVNKKSPEPGPFNILKHLSFYSVTAR